MPADDLFVIPSRRFSENTPPAPAAMTLMSTSMYPVGCESLTFSVDVEDCRFGLN